MTLPATLLLVVAAVAMIADWAAVGAGSKPLEYVAKPLALLPLSGVAATVDVPPDLTGARVAVVAACGLSFAGDVFLMLPTDRFVFGLASFLLAHLAYVVAFLLVGQTAWAVLGLFVVAAALRVVGTRVLGAVRRTERALLGPVVTYVAVISAMVVAAVGSGLPTAGAGACLFYASDACIAWRRFVDPRAWMGLFIIVTYHAGQVLLVLSLV